MTKLKVSDIREEFKLLLAEQKFVTDKTGVKTLEIIGSSFIADEDAIFGEPNKNYIERELQWYLSQSLNVNDIPGKVPEIWRQVATRDGLINSNYGNLVFSIGNYKQYDSCLASLICNDQTRRAIMIYTRPQIQHDYCRDGMSDFICTNAVQYFIRGGKLITVVSMRSNDVFFGFANDLAWQKYIRDRLLCDYNRLTSSSIISGDIIWEAGSLHVYERHFDKVK